MNLVLLPGLDGTGVLLRRLVAALVGTRHSFGKAKFQTPCCYLRAKQDRLVPAALAEWFLARFSKCRVEEIDGPHLLLQAKPREAAQAIRRIAAEFITA